MPGKDFDSTLDRKCGNHCCSLCEKSCVLNTSATICRGDDRDLEVSTKYNQGRYPNAMYSNKNLFHQEGKK